MYQTRFFSVGPSDYRFKSLNHSFSLWWNQISNSVHDLANGLGQLGSGLTHAGSGQMGSGQKTGRTKWVAQPMTLTQSFKGRVKTGLTHIFTHENIYIYIKWKQTWSYNPKLSFSFLCLPFNTNKRTHKQKHSQIKEYGKKKNTRCHKPYQIINLLRCTFFLLIETP